jgi:glutamate dehydrogenase
VLDARGLWAEIEALDGKVHGNAQIDALLRIWNLMRHLTRWLLNLPGHRLDIAAAVARYQPGMNEIRACLPEVMADSDRQMTNRELDTWAAAGFPLPLAQQLSQLPALMSALDVVEVASERGLPVRRVAEVYYALGEALHLKWIAEKIEVLPVEGRWHAHARGTLRDELFAHQQELAAQVLAKGDAASGGELVDRWLKRDDPALKFTLAMFADMHSQVSMDYPTVSVAVRRLGQLVQAGSRA